MTRLFDDPAAPVSPRARTCVRPVPSTTVAARGLPYMASLDGLRGVAVLGVLLFHGGVALTGGFLGVSTFFTLSGFLITTLLLTEYGKGRGIGLRRFWAHRVRRLMPAALIAIALGALFTLVAGGAYQRLTFRGDGLAALFYVANWRFIASGQSYASLFGSPSAVLPFWSLAIEEQFYVVFPLFTLLVLHLARGSKRIFGAVLAVLFVISASLPLVARGVFHWSTDRVYFGTDTRAAELLAGALLAVGLSVRGRSIDAVDARWSQRTRLIMGAVGAVALELTVVLWWRAEQSSDWVSGGGLPVYGGLTALVILAALVPGNLVHVVLSVRPLRELGRISYGVYLYHWPIFLWLSPARTSWSPLVRLLVAGSITLAVATVSFVYLEQPIRERRFLRSLPDPNDPFPPLPHGPWFARAAPMAIGVVVVLIFAATTSRSEVSLQVSTQAASGTLISDLDLSGTDPIAHTYDTAAAIPDRPVKAHVAAAPPTTARVAAATPSTTLTTAVAPSTAATPPTSPTPPISDPTSEVVLTPKPLRFPSRPLRLLVVGDSTGAYLDPALNAWGGTNKVWGAANFARIGCGVGRGGSRINHDIVEAIPPDCSSWATDWPAALRTAQPDVVVVADSFWDAVDRQIPGDDQWRGPGDPIYDAYLVRELGAAADLLASTHAMVAWLDNPPIELGLNEVPQRTYAVNQPARMTRTNQLLAQVAATRPFMRVIPYSSFIDAWPGGPLDPELRPDGLHVDSDGGATVATWLGPEILDAYWSVKHPK